MLVTDICNDFLVLWECLEALRLLRQCIIRSLVVLNLAEQRKKEGRKERKKQDRKKFSSFLILPKFYFVW